MNEKEMCPFIAMAYQAYKCDAVLDGFKILHHDKTNDYGVEYVFAKDNDGRVYLAFAGTNDIKDILIDLDFWQKTIPYNNTETKIRIHKGFYKAYLSVRIRMLSYLIEHKIKQIYITGHSYGAALALLAAVDIQYNLPNILIDRVVTFGCPRIGNKAFVESFQRRVPNTYRVENGNDLVTKIPPTIMGYRHNGIVVHIGKPRRWWAISLVDHFARNYKDLIQNSRE